MGKLGLRFWENATLEFNEVRAAEHKNKYFKKDIESDITKLSTKSKEYRIKKKIIEAGGKINYNIRSFFSKTYTEINLDDTYKIDQLLDSFCLKIFNYVYARSATFFNIHIFGVFCPKLSCPYNIIVIYFCASCI